MAAVAPAPDHPLRVDDLARQFRGVRALDGVSLDAAAGEVLGLIGPNGAARRRC